MVKYKYYISKNIDIVTNAIRRPWSRLNALYPLLYKLDEDQSLSDSIHTQCHSDRGKG